VHRERPTHTAYLATGRPVQLMHGPVPSRPAGSVHPPIPADHSHRRRGGRLIRRPPRCISDGPAGGEENREHEECREQPDQLLASLADKVASLMLEVLEKLVSY
jgi:hypothetical protein